MNDELRRRFVKMRKELGLSQKQVAEKSGVSLRAISAFETGDSMPQRSNMEALLQVVPVPILAGPVEPERATMMSGDEVTRAWPADISVFLDVLGLYLLRFDEDERQRIIYSVTRQIFEHPPLQDSSQNLPNPL